MYAHEMAWHRKHFLENWWHAIWSDFCVQLSVVSYALSVLVGMATSSSDMITVLGGVVIAVLAGISGVIKAAAPMMEIWFRHRENIEKIRHGRRVHHKPQAPDSSEFQEPSRESGDPDEIKKARVQRRRKKDHQEPPVPPENEATP